VLPANEHDPTFTAPAGSDTTISETITPGTLVDTFIATDDDIGDDGQVEYGIAVADRKYNIHGLYKRNP